MSWVNWGGNQSASPRRVVHAVDVAEVVDTVKAAARDGGRVKAVGAGHSFTGIAVTDDIQLSLPASPAGCGSTPHTGWSTYRRGSRCAN